MTLVQQQPSELPPAPPLGQAHLTVPGRDPAGQGPLAEGAFEVPSWKADDPEVMTWEEIQQTCATGNLDDLKRTRACEARYATWSKPIREKWGGLESYIRSVRLGWAAEDDVAVASMDERHVPHFVDTTDERLVRRLPNDWPYSIPPGAEHWVVWSRLPIYSPALFHTPETPFAPGAARDALYAAISHDGVRGMTGIDTLSGPRVFGQATRAVLSKAVEINTTPTRPCTPTASLQRALSAPAPYGSPGAPSRPPSPGRPEDAALMAERAQAWAGRFVRAYVTRVWNEREWETAWFCNPPHLRTVPGLSHFHVIARRKAR